MRLKVVKTVMLTFYGPTFHLQSEPTLKVHWHSSADVPFFNKLNSESVMAQPGSLRRRALAIRETVNEPEVRDVPWEQRRCLYPDEGALKLYRHYSYSACVVECRQRAALQLCNCSSHLLPPIGQLTLREESISNDVVTAFRAECN